MLRERLGLTFGWIAILLRLASDWIFGGGSPLVYQLIQAGLLGLGIAALWPELDRLFLRGGDNARSLREGALAFPIAVLLGVVSASARFGAPRWPSPAQVPEAILGSLLFTAVEELEFRGFLLALLLRFGVRTSAAAWIQAAVHTLAHSDRLVGGYYVSLLLTLVITFWFGSLVLRTRSLWGAWLAHLAWNVGILLPELGTGLLVRS